jgi:hypothetical protein
MLYAIFHDALVFSYRSNADARSANKFVKINEYCGRHRVTDIVARVSMNFHFRQRFLHVRRLLTVLAKKCPLIFVSNPIDSLGAIIARD